MKMLVISVVCALAGSVCGGSVAWPSHAVALQAPLLNTIIPAQTKAFGYSTTQYINTLPPSYSLGLQPQFSYQVPHLSGISSLPSTYYPAGDLTYYPASVFYPTAGSIVPGVPSSPFIPSAPVAPSQPSQPPSSPSEQLNGDADTAVIDSADVTSEQQRQEQSSTSQIQFGPTPPAPANRYPNFPSIPQLPQGSGQIPFPQIPQFPQVSFPSLPQLPQLPQIPSNPLFPQTPTDSPQSSFPGSSNDDKGLNDEDTISVDSA